MGSVSLISTIKSTTPTPLIEKAHTSERECALQHLPFTEANDLVLYDRGYPAFWLYSALLQRAQPFCMRLKTKLDLTIRHFVNSRKKQAVVEFIPTSRAVEQCAQRGLPATPMKLRLIRVKLKSEVEVLVTNLFNETAFPVSVFKDLYHQRWGVEENYKRQKQWLEIENFSGKSAESVRQDFHAKIVSLNLTAMMVFASGQQHASKTATRQHRYKINFAANIGVRPYILHHTVWPFQPPINLDYALGIA